MEERPICIVFGGEDGNILIVTTNNSIYGIRIK